MMIDYMPELSLKNDISDLQYCMDTGKTSSVPGFLPGKLPYCLHPIVFFSQLITQSLISQSPKYKLIIAPLSVLCGRVTQRKMRTLKSEILLNKATKHHQISATDHGFWLANLAAMPKILTVDNLL